MTAHSSHIEVSFGMYGWRGLGWGFSRWRTAVDGEITDHVWFPMWTLKLGPVLVRRLACTWSC